MNWIDASLVKPGQFRRVLAAIRIPGTQQHFYISAMWCGNRWVLFAPVSGEYADPEWWAEEPLSPDDVLRAREGWNGLTVKGDIPT